MLEIREPFVSPVWEDLNSEWQWIILQLFLKM